MLTIETYRYKVQVMESGVGPEAGRGVFAAQDIPIASMIMSDHCYRIDMPPPLHDAHKKSGVYWLAFNDRKEQGKWLIALGCMSLMNHSDTPNVKVVQTGDMLCAVSIRNIKAGDELLYEYYNRSEYDF